MGVYAKLSLEILKKSRLYWKWRSKLLLHWYHIGDHAVIYTLIANTCYTISYRITCICELVSFGITVFNSRPILCPKHPLHHCLCASVFFFKEKKRQLTTSLLLKTNPLRDSQLTTSGLLLKVNPSPDSQFQHLVIDRMVNTFLDEVFFVYLFDSFHNFMIMAHSSISFNFSVTHSSLSYSHLQWPVQFL